MTIRSWLERDSTSTAAETLEVSRLRRENEALLRIIGQLRSQAEVREKISAVAVAEPGSKMQLAKEFGVSRASLYFHPKMPAKDDELRRRIETVILENPGYGSPRFAIGSLRAGGTATSTD